MSALRQWLYGLALLGALGLLLWAQQQRIAVALRDTQLAHQAAASAEQAQARSQAIANRLHTQLQQERQAQTALRQLQHQLREGLAQRELAIEALKREHADFQHWAAQPLPATARQLRQRPAATGADAYRQWLPGGAALPPAGQRPSQ
jgi:LysB family phage lysis regulatory protein